MMSEHFKNKFKKHLTFKKMLDGYPTKMFKEKTFHGWGINNVFVLMIQEHY